MKFVTIRYWDADVVPNPEYHYQAHNDPLADEHGYRMGKSDLWDTSAIKKSDKEHSILKEETYEGGVPVPARCAGVRCGF